MIVETTKPPCDYHLVDGNIHQFVFHQSSLQAVDAFFDALEIVLSQAGSEPVLLLIDISRFATKLPSFSYIHGRLKHLIAAYPKRPAARAVIIHDYGMIIGSLQTFIKIMPIKRESIYHFIAASESDRAIPWLLQRPN